MRGLPVSWLAICGLLACSGTNGEGMRGETSQRREMMVAEQIERRGVKDPRVLAAMRKVPRHEFVPAEVQGHAYDDRPLPIGHGQTISQPYIVAFMTEALALEGDEKVLEIGTGSGFQAAVLGELAKQVYTIEIVEPLGRNAAEVLKRLGYDNVKTRIGDGFQGWREEAPFDAVIVTCAPDDVPRPLVDQLADGGRMIIPVGPEGKAQQLVLLRKKNGHLTRTESLPVRFVPMTGEAQE
ncbi:protein-L-isoaspartate(D-aspartate) O-methyltransferase [Luteolibacter marinus]|uniref:protein-L-isoaspartate(D-aspartate) O-methyltransferase n=1 Tax=Luteolibacter marinus TaxID=2776705 RepID=UPI0018660414|nr:protein-L-isoaspartate(D-aspartate) O-methyltransferase [Luteolibacter marinus]